MFDKLLPRHRLLQWRINAYPPFLGAGVKIERISPDFREIDVRLPLTGLNRNYVGTQFGGSLYSMTDPFYMLMLLENLGSDYIVWDKSAQIAFLKPGRAAVHASFRLNAADIERIRDETATGFAAIPVYVVDIRDDSGDIIARVEKTLYVRRKKMLSQPERSRSHE